MRRLTGPVVLLTLTIGGWATLRTAYIALQYTVPADDDAMPGLLFPIGLDPPAADVANRAVGAAPLPGVRAVRPVMPPATEVALRGARAQATMAAASDASSTFVAAQMAMLRYMLRPMRADRWTMQRFVPGPDTFPPAAAPPAALQRFGGDNMPQRWAASAWALYRGGAVSAASLARQGRIGGSQAGARLSYRLGGDGNVHAFGRVTATPGLGVSAEAALGLAWRPAARWPVTAVVERRQALVGSDARSDLAAYVTGGVSDAPLPAGFSLDAYGAAGVVGLRRRDAFAEGSLRAVRPLAHVGPVRLAVGGGAWAAAQPGASRVDVGPALVTRIGAGNGPSARIALDYRTRVAGESAPGSGIALTLSSDF